MDWPIIFYQLRSKHDDYMFDCILHLVAGQKVTKHYIFFFQAHCYCAHYCWECLALPVQCSDLDHFVCMDNLSCRKPLCQSAVSSITLIHLTITKYSCYFPIYQGIAFTLITVCLALHTSTSVETTQNSGMQIESTTMPGTAAASSLTSPWQWTSPPLLIFQ